jgi:hypothetical protein
MYALEDRELRRLSILTPRIISAQCLLMWRNFLFPLLLLTSTGEWKHTINDVMISKYNTTSISKRKMGWYMNIHDIHLAGEPVNVILVTNVLHEAGYDKLVHS